MAAGDKQTGFTLIELLVTIAVIIIIATIAVPGFRTMVADNRLTADFNQVLTGLHYARSEAAKRRANVSVDIVDADSTDPWKLVVEAGASGAESTLRVIEGRDTSVSVTPLGVGFNALGRRSVCSADPCSLTMSYEGEETLTVNLAGNISRP